MCPALPDPANDDFRPVQGDAVARYFATRGLRRGLTAVASFLAALILAFTMVHGMQADSATEPTLLSRL